MGGIRRYQCRVGSLDSSAEASVCYRPSGVFIKLFYSVQSVFYVFVGQGRKRQNGRKWLWLKRDW
jgi:hypothetical protein